MYFLDKLPDHQRVFQFCFSSTHMLELLRNLHHCPGIVRIVHLMLIRHHRICRWHLPSKPYYLHYCKSPWDQPKPHYKELRTASLDQPSNLFAILGNPDTTHSHPEMFFQIDLILVEIDL